MKRVSKKSHGWAIRHRYDGREYLLGRYCFTEYRTLTVREGDFPDCMRGYVAGVFKIRRDARDWLRDEKQRGKDNAWMLEYNHFMAVVKVSVTVAEIGRA